jgi:hypothetical protein
MIERAGAALLRSARSSVGMGRHLSMRQMVTLPASGVKSPGLVADPPHRYMPSIV